MVSAGWRMSQKPAILFFAFALAVRAALLEVPAHLAPGGTIDLWVDSLHPASLVLDVGRNKASLIVIDQDELSVHFRILSDDGREIRAAWAGYPGIFLISLPPSGSATVHLVATSQATQRTPATVAVSLEPSSATGSDLAAQRNRFFYRRSFCAVN
jgi:hypothetical protein